MRIGGIVVCGGESRRMGSPKEWLRLDGEPLLARVVRVAGGVADQVVVAARPGQSLPPLPSEVSVVYDRISGAGPLAGLAAGFEQCSGTCDAALVIASDHALVRGEVLSRLVTLLENHPAVTPSFDGRLYPLLAIYRLSTAGLLGQMLSAGERRVREFAVRCGAHLVDAEDFRDVDPQLDSFLNINEPADYDRIVRRSEA